MDKLNLSLRQRKLLHMMQEQTTYITGNELAKQLGVSPRTIRSDIVEINQNILPYHAKILSARSKGYLYTAENPEIIQQLNQIDTAFFTKEDRIRYLAFRLCLTDEHLNLFDLEDEMFISHTTLEHDLHSLKMKYVLSEPYIKLEQKRNFLTFEENEQKRRSVLNRLFHEDWNYNHNWNTYYGYTFLNKDVLDYIMDEVPLHLDKYGISMEDPSLVSLNLAAAINRYNEVLVERKRLLRTSTENNPTIINLDTSISAMKENVQVSLDRVLRGLFITKADLDREANRYSRRISEAPGQEREFVSIARQQEIKAGLYLMLLQKREENAITLAATANNAKIIDDAIADDAPVSPKRKMIYLIALVLGVGIPVGVIYLLELTKFKIEGRSDVEKLTSLPIVGDIPLTDEKQGAIAVFENQNNLMSETFRNIRTNLQFMLENDKKVILVTSTVSGEGKSFISANLAISLSLLGKKVVIVGLDIRKPGLNKVFNIPRKEVGITQYLANPEKNLMDLVQLSDVSKNLYILPGGTVPPNPTELLARDGLDKAIETLKKNFDYVILDTAPVGMVTDTLLIGRVADLSVYVCRADYTHKNEYTLINELAEKDKLPSLCTVINGLDLKKRKYGYYYGYGKYGKYYGYGKRYGYGYGYGEQSHAKED